MCLCCSYATTSGPIQTKFSQPYAYIQRARTYDYTITSDTLSPTQTRTHGHARKLGPSIECISSMHAERLREREFANLMNDLDIVYTSQISTISPGQSQNPTNTMLQESRMLTPATASRSFNRQLYTNLSLLLPLSLDLSHSLSVDI